MNPFEGYRITSPYGWRNDPFTGAKRYHTGIDLVKAHQAPIHSFTDGLVIHAKEGVRYSGFGNYGNVVAVKSDDGHLHCYCHLDSISVKVGQFIKQGDEVGKQGSTGRSTGSHLHYEVRSKTSPSYGYGFDVDPAEYLIRYNEKREDEEIMLSKDDATKVIAFLSAAYMCIPNEDGKEEFHRLANELRKLSGQEVQ